MPRLHQRLDMRLWQLWARISPATRASIVVGLVLVLALLLMLLWELLTGEWLPDTIMGRFGL